MSRDYAPRSGGQRRHTRSNSSSKRRSGGGIPGWIWMVAGLAIGLAVAAIVYINRPTTAPIPSQARDDDSRAAAAPTPSGKSSSAQPDQPTKLKLPPKEKERFSFYELLKNQEVVLPNEAAKSTKPPDTPPPPNPKTPAPADAPDGSYIIQVASYRSQNEAEKQKASLALMGVESRIESVTIDGKDTYYRVRIGPDSNWTRVQKTMARLESNGIQALLVKVN
ncbi:SPOR domain-containing protein [Solimonas marina]|uniref:SPOR domain-containing protein n=1 Tax=Solimonas marina TaxID=2714601 RepID=A0A969W5T3_9GAMM|nr:SPOR domain-containing protein [Solimonas marina]NKF21107.1 hypothetical protein [Solimonas marina]